METANGNGSAVPNRVTVITARGSATSVNSADVQPVLGGRQASLLDSSSQDEGRAFTQEEKRLP
jgi:hypothetical protein